MPYRFPQAKIQEAIVRGVIDGLDEVALTFQRGMVEKLSQPGSGRHYPGNPTRSSAIGEPPAAQTGTLKRSWTFSKPKARIEGNLAIARVSSNVFYAPYLEAGTRKMGRRPSVQPVVRETNAVAAGIIHKRVARRLARFNRGAS